MINGRGNEPNIYSYFYLSGLNCFTVALYAGGGPVKKKTKKFILEFLEFWPLTIVIPLMLIGIVLGAALGWGG